MGLYLIGPLVTLIPLGSISFWVFKLYCDDGLLGISPTVSPLRVGREGVSAPWSEWERFSFAHLGASIAEFLHASGARSI